MSTTNPAIMPESSAGLAITQFPATIGAASIPAKIAQGKFHGEMLTPTPSGMDIRPFSSPSNQVVSAAPKPEYFMASRA